MVVHDTSIRTAKNPSDDLVAVCRQWRRVFRAIEGKKLTYVAGLLSSFNFVYNEGQSTDQLRVFRKSTKAGYFSVILTVVNEGERFSCQ